jgi:hypothetical protein
LKALLLDRWRALREADALGTLLPRCTDRWIGEPAAQVGFVTLDYRVYRDLALADDVPAPDLVEMYWSVRIKAGEQDPQWAASVNAHVLLVTEGPVGVELLERLHRQVVTLRRALQLGGIGALLAGGKAVALHTRGLLLGADFSGPGEIVDALANRADVPLSVGRFELVDDEFRFSSSGAPSRFEQGQAQPEPLRILGERLLRHDQLFKSQGRWNRESGESTLPALDDDVL